MDGFHGEDCCIFQGTSLFGRAPLKHVNEPVNLMTKFVIVSLRAATKLSFAPSQVLHALQLHEVHTAELHFHHEGASVLRA